MKIRSNPRLAQTKDRRQAAATITESLLSSEQQSYLLILYVYTRFSLPWTNILQKLSGFASMGPGYVNLSLWHPGFVRINPRVHAP